MRPASGFTLIELLLVLAIIGIISAIAIPALLSQRSRARDKASITTVVGHLSDLVGQYDLARDSGQDPAQVTASLNAYLASTLGNAQSPWGTGPAFNTTLRPPITGATTSAEFEAQMTPNNILGKGRVYIQFPANGTPGFLGVVLLVQEPINGSTTVARATALD